MDQRLREVAEGSSSHHQWDILPDPRDPSEFQVPVFPRLKAYEEGAAKRLADEAQRAKSGIMCCSLPFEIHHFLSATRQEETRKANELKRIAQGQNQARTTHFVVVASLTLLSIDARSTATRQRGTQARY
jgi:hypothetical protein